MDEYYWSYVEILKQIGMMVFKHYVEITYTKERKRKGFKIKFQY